MRIVFYCSPAAYLGRRIFNPHSLETGIGGSECALVYISRSLATLGHKVSVYNNVQESAHFDGVSYHPAGSFEDEVETDVFVLFRFFAPEVGRVRGGAKILWSTDIPTSESPYQLDKSLPLVDSVFAISPFHADCLLQFGKSLGINGLASKLWVTSCGVNAEDYQTQAPKVKNQTLFCSVPDRGLDTLLEIWPAIQSRVDDATLVITSDYSLWGLPPGNEEFRERAKGLPGVSFLGAIPRRQLILHQLESDLHLHPCGIPENFCLASMECQAAGTPTITSSMGAMRTTVVDGRSGVIVPGMPTSPAFRSRFTETVVALLNDRRRLGALAHYARKRAISDFDYMKVAERWQRKMETVTLNARRGIAANRK